MRTLMRGLALTAVLALALSGGAVAAKKLTSKDIRDNTLTTKDVKNRSLLARDFKTGQLPSGPAGPAGASGPQGPQGPQGPAGPVGVSAIEAVAGSVEVPIDTVGGGTMPCPAGQRVVSGGYQFVADDGEVYAEFAEQDRASYTVLVDNLDGIEPGQLTVIAYCARTNQAVAAGARRRPRLRAPTGHAARLIAAREAISRR
jgi:hypothetical protein